MKVLPGLIICLLLLGCTSTTESEMTPQGIQGDQSAASHPEAREEEKLDELRIVLAQLDPGPLSKDEYRSLTRHPYSRDPFLENPLASQAYFNGFRSGFAQRTRQPGQLVFRGKLSGSLIDAADDAGFSAGITGELSQLSGAERQEVNDWKRKYKEVSMWPFISNIESEIKIKMQLLTEEEDSSP